MRVPRTCFHNLANFPPARPAGWGSKCSKPLGSDEPRREREPSQWQQFTPSARQKIKAAQQRYFGESERKTALAGNGATAPLLGAAGVWVLSLSWGTPKSPLPAACTQKSLRPAESRVTTPPPGLDLRPRPAQGLQGLGVMKERVWYKPGSRLEPEPKSHRVVAAGRAQMPQKRADKTEHSLQGRGGYLLSETWRTPEPVCTGRLA